MVEDPQQVRFVEYDQEQSEQTVQETPPFRVHSDCVLSVLGINPTGYGEWLGSLYTGLLLTPS